MENEFTQFYKEHNISPVSQDLSDINLHLKRRANLYQMLGIDKRLFKNRDVLEVGPGSGFNSICFCKWGANLDLVEPNDKGRKEISQNLNGYKFRLYDDFIENFVSSKKYDFVIAEGFLPSLNNSKDILSSLIKLVKKDGILVTTCIDEFSHFYEDLRRITGFILIRN
ncbi:TPA: methyltransferase domain-containing protein, partial [Campylobacter fetus]|nr:methyltransferase domain-containing protein [Campylobacter fetus]